MYEDQNLRDNWYRKNCCLQEAEILCQEDLNEVHQESIIALLKSSLNHNDDYRSPCLQELEYFYQAPLCYSYEEIINILENTVQHGKNEAELSKRFISELFISAYLFLTREADYIEMTERTLSSKPGIA